MIRPQLILDLSPKLIIDNFAGGGGWSTGEELAIGRHVDHAINHAHDALGMHRINHPQTVHHCEDVFDIDPLVITEGRPVGHAHFSPDCKHFSKAKGGKPLDKRIRGLAFVILRWAKIRPDVITMENVEEIKTWGPLLPDGRPDKAHIGRTWEAFLDALGGGVQPDHPDIPEMLEVLAGSVTREDLVRGFGYDVETRELRACDYGSPTIRKRLYMIARCDGRPIVWPKPTHAAPEQARKLSLKPYRTVAEQIDWSIPCNSIFLTAKEARKFRCRRPLKAATLRRIARGIDRYVLKASKPFLVNLTHQGGDRVEGLDEPASTISSKGSQQQVVFGNLAAYFGNEQDGQGLVEPCRTVTTKDRFGLCQSKAVNHGLTPEQLAGAMRVAAFLREHGVEFEGEFATLEVDGVRFVIVDIGMRMLTPRELFRCQGFPESYVIDRAWLVDPRTGSLKEIVLTKEQQIRMCGNSVCPQVAQAICAANLSDLSILTKRERLTLERHPTPA